jgi:hypothetical protein
VKISRHIALATLIAAVAAATATAAAPNKAKTLVLQKADFPAGTVAKPAGGTVSSAGSGYAVAFHYRSAGKPNELSSFVAVLPSRSAAVQAFRELRDEMAPGVPKLELPRYGDEQAANFSVLGGSQLVVRKGSVVWAIELQTIVTRGGQTHDLTRAEAVAEYKKYGPKQQLRIGTAGR